MKGCLVGLILILIVSVGLAGFYIYQLSVAFSVLQGFWLISSSEDGDFYAVINDGDIQIVCINQEGMELLHQEEITSSFRSLIPLTSFKYKLSRKGSSTALDQLFGKESDIYIELYPSVGCADISCSDSKKRLIKDNVMTLAYLMS